MINRDKIDGLKNRIEELEAITEILREISDDPSKDPVTVCREKEIDVDRFLHYAGDLVKVEITNIEDLDMWVRSVAVLKRTGINTISQLCQLTIADIIRIPHMGFRSAADIVNALEKHGIPIAEGAMTPDEHQKLENTKAELRKMSNVKIKMTW